MVNDDAYRAFLDALSLTAVFHNGDYYYRGFITDVSTKITTLGTFHEYLENIPPQDEETEITVSDELYDLYVNDSEYADYEQMCTTKNLTIVTPT